MKLILFIDYRIRERSEEEKKVKLTKETQHLVEYEEGLLRNYQLFLKSLEKKILNRNRPGSDLFICIYFGIFNLFYRRISLAIQASSNVDW